MSVDLSILPQCTKCRLAETRTQVVVGSGPLNAQVMFIGEAPGRNEDAGGKPFIGAAGKVLDEFLERAHLSRDDIYITNIVKCRPPHNRNPLDDEIDACQDWIAQQIVRIKPEVIVALGAVAAQWLTGSTRPMRDIAGRLGSYEYTDGSDTSADTGVNPGADTSATTGVPHRTNVLVVYHPAATIYNRNLRDAFFMSADRLKAILDAKAGQIDE